MTMTKNRVVRAFGVRRRTLAIVIGAIAPLAALGLASPALAVEHHPTGEFEQMAADVSVDHPHEVDNYRVAHAIALRAQRGETSTEDLRKAMVHFRALFEDLLETNVRRPEEVRL